MKDTNNFKPVIFDKIEKNELYNVQNNYDSFQCELKDIVLDDKLNVGVNNNNYYFTDFSFSTFCKVHKIPSPFVNLIPMDLFLHNIDRLKKELNDIVYISYRKNDNAIVNIVKMKKSHFQVISSDNMLEYFGSDRYDMFELKAGDFGCIADIIHADLGKVEVRKGDIINFGYRLENPFTRISNALIMSLYANQVVCSNGMVLPKDLLHTSVNLTKILGEESDYLDLFRNKIDNEIGVKYYAETFENILKGMLEMKIKYRWLKSIIPMLNKYNLIKSVLKIDWDEDKKIYMEKFRNDEMGDSDYTFFEVLYGATEQAKSLTKIYEKNMLESESSKIFQLFKNQKSITSAS